MLLQLWLNYCTDGVQRVNVSLSYLMDHLTLIISLQMNDHVPSLFQHNFFRLHAQCKLNQVIPSFKSNRNTLNCSGLDTQRVTTDFSLVGFLANQSISK